MRNKDLITKLIKNEHIEKSEWIKLLETATDSDISLSAEIARGEAKKQFGNGIYMRGLIEISNICKNDCKYCGIRKSNDAVRRYRMTSEEILKCAKIGYESGFRTFVLQGGEDGYFSDEILSEIIFKIKEKCPDCAVTLSMGERSKKSYEALFSAGADRYLLRHETADEAHYKRLHPENMSYKNRMECLKNLKEIGFQTGCGMMIGSPYQTAENLAEDMLFLEQFRPHMVGIGPFLPAENTPFENEKAGTLDKTLFVLSLVRIMLKNVLLPATTALGTLAKDGRVRAILSGANVMMPNISPTQTRKDYSLYDGKIGAGETAVESIQNVKDALAKIGYVPLISRGDYK